MLGFNLPENYLKDCSISSINGLICVAIEEKDLFLWNPSIRKLKKLPDYETSYVFSYGFEYDELHDDYKVVGIIRSVRDIYSHSDVGKIYSLNNNSWSCLDDFQTGIPFMKPGMFVNGKLHWAITTKRFRYNNYWDIIFVDLANEKLGEIEKPMDGEGNFVYMSCLSVLGNDLSTFSSQLISHLDLWVMKDTGLNNLGQRYLPSNILMISWA
ncbi:hypothetical protein H5410_048981 [Solanum commersonii]|uniref:F-box associated beta-propeller type 1 domain-containing protein n=1 Tax=Solanum commersonii TaxID=4109 RepID=A0A9J5XJS4_SOLCO|nr:hypothetical protein H5410_048981 [Solanum commersonii]